MGIQAIRFAAALFALALAPAVPAIDFTVDTADQDLAVSDSNADDDLGDGACATAMGACTLRAAIQQANASVGRDGIEFDAAIDTIELTDNLPEISDEVDISGRIVGAAPDIVIDGMGLQSTFEFLATAADNDGSSLTGLVIINGNGDGVSLDGGPYILDTLWIGIDKAGAAAGNTGNGIAILSTDPHGFALPDLSALGVEPNDIASLGVPALQALIGTDASAITNSVIGANAEDGVLITGANTGGVILAGNRIGTSPAGNEPRGNGQGTTGSRNGVHINDQAFFNVVIGNVISANGSGGDGDGVLVSTGPVLWPNLIGGNTIGLPDPTNAPALFLPAEWGNAASGVRLESFPDPGNPTEVSAIVSGNLIGQNRCGKVDVDNDSADIDAGGIAITNGAGASDRAIVVANLVGVAEFPVGGGIVDLGNLCNGINVSDGSHIIGGANALDANAIGANDGDGILLRNTTTNGSVLKGNRIGRDISDSLTFGNTGHGIFLSNSGGNTIGFEDGDAPLFAPNVIVGNGGHGIKVAGANAFGNLLRRNRIYGVPPTFLAIDLDRDNATPDVADPIDDDDTSVDPLDYSNWGQNTVQICGSGGAGACAGAADPSFSGGNTTVQWTLFSFRNATFRVDVYAISDDDAQWLHEELVTTDIDGIPTSSGPCDASALCTSSFASSSTSGTEIVLTATRIDENIADLPPIDGDLSDEGPVNNTSEFSVAAVIPDQVQFTAADYPVGEADGVTMLVTVTRTGSGDGAASVEVVVAPGTAGAGDYGATTPQPLSWNDGETGDRTVAVTVNEDAVFEGAETVAFSLDAPSNVAPGTQAAATLTIADNDPQPMLSIAGDSSAEGDMLQFVVMRTGASELPVQATYTVLADSAGTPGDYDGSGDPLTGTVTILPAASDAILTIATNEDAVHEADEDLQVELSAPTNASIGGGPAIGTILDDDPQPQLAVDDPAVTEGSDGSVVFTVTKVGQTALASSVDYTVVPGSAGTPGDYAPGDALAGTLAFAAADVTRQVTLVLVDDADSESAEQFTLQLSNAVDAGIAMGTGTASITDDDFDAGDLQFTAATFADAEGDGPGSSMVALVERVGGSDGAATVDCVIAAGGGVPATPGIDFTASSVPLSWADGEAGTRSCVLPLLGDLLDEEEETIALTLANPVGADAGPQAAAVFTINDDDLPPSVSWAGDLAASEGDAGTTPFTFQATLSGPSGRAVSVDATTMDGSAQAGTDFTANAATLMFVAGVTSQPFTVDVLGDTDDEGDQDFTVLLSSAVNASIVTPAATGTVLNDDAPPPMQGELRFVTASDGVSEAGGAVAVSVERINGSDGAVSVTCTSQAGSAGPADFTAGSQVLSWADGDVVQKDCTVPLLDDALDEDDETLTLVLSAPQGGAVLAAPSSATLTLLDNDELPVLSVAPLALDEGDAGTTVFAFQVTLSPASGRSVSVAAATSDGTATAGSDYTAAMATLDFPAGTTLQVFAVDVLGDTDDEGEEAFGVALSAPVDATLGTPSATGSVLNDDAPPPMQGELRFVAATASVSEGAGSGGIAVERINGVDGAVSVTCTAQAGSAGAADFTAGSQQLNWGDGITGAQACDVALLDDALDEDDETLTLALSAPQGGATLASPSIATLTLLDDDAEPVLAIAPLALGEGDAGTTAFDFQVTLTPASGRVVSVSVATSDGTATAGSDYTAATATLAFAPGETGQAFPVGVIGDTGDEPDETFTASLSAPSNATLVTASAAGTILNDDAPVPAQGELHFASASTTVAEDGGTATIVVRRSGGSDGAVTVAYASGDGSAGAPDDYAAVAGTLGWADGDGADKSFSIAVVDDGELEPTQTVLLSLSAPTGGAVLGAPATSTLSILDDEVAGTTSFSGPTIPDGGTETVVITGGGDTCGFVAGTGLLGPPPGAAPVPPSLPPGDWDFPYGMTQLAIDACTPGAEVTVTVTFPAPLPAGAVLWKYGPTQVDPSPHWYAYPATLAGAVATFALVDGGDGDADLQPDGAIADPFGIAVPQGGGPVGPPGGVPQARVIPAGGTTASVALALLLLTLGLLAVHGARRH